jgi:hypothetical protein
MKAAQEAAEGGGASRAEESLKKLAQLIQELGRDVDCPVCLQDLRVAETNPEHPSFTRLLYCGHSLCGGCAFDIKNLSLERHRCPVCKDNITKQIEGAVASVEGAESRLRPPRDAADLGLAAADAIDASGADGEEAQLPQGAFVLKSYPAACFVCQTNHPRGSVVKKHARLPSKVTCAGCAEKALPCALCSGDASVSDVLQNTVEGVRKMYCLECVRQGTKRGSEEVRSLRGAAQFLKKARQTPK